MKEKSIHTYISMGMMVAFLWVQHVYADAGISERKSLLKREEVNMTEYESGSLTSDMQAKTLEEYLQKGLHRNPGLKAVFYKWKAAFQEVSKAFSLSDPEFTFTEYIDEVETRVGPQKQAYMLKQKFPLSDKLWIRKNKAFRVSEAAYYDFEKKRLDLIYKISESYYEYAYLNKAILLTEENMRLLGNFESVAQAKYASGLQKNQDLLKAQVELGRLENDLQSLNDFRNPLVSRLNALLNHPADYALPWPDESLEDLTLEEEYADAVALIDSLKENNPELLALSEEVKKSEEDLKLSQREYFPDLTVGFTHIDTDSALSPSTVDSGKDPQLLSFSVNVPIWFDRLAAGVREARARLKVAEEKRANAENELVSQLAFVHYKLRDSLRQSRLYKDALISKAGQTLNATQSGYEAGNVDFLSLIDAQRVLLNFQLAFYRHNANFYQRLSELKSLLGEINIKEDEHLNTAEK